MAGSRIKILDRRLRILFHLMLKGFTTFTDLSREFSVRKETITRDIEYLVSSTPYVQVQGERIFFLPFSPFDEKFFQRLSLQQKEKEAVAKYAFKHFVASGDKIFIDGATSGYMLALEIAFSDLYHLEVLVSNVFFLNLLNKKISDVRLKPGFLNRNRASIETANWYDFSQENINKAFIGFDGISYDRGLYTSPHFAETLRDVALSTRELVVCLGDHSKIGKSPREKALDFQDLEKKGVPFKIIIDDNLPSTGNLKKDKEQRDAFHEELQKFPDGTVEIVKVGGK